MLLEVSNLFFVLVYHLTIASLMYLTSFILDLFDGIAARKFNQCSDFGGLLDMITDRCSTLGLFFILYGEYGTASKSNEYKLVSSILLHYHCDLYSFFIHSKPQHSFQNCCLILVQKLFLMLALLDISSHWCQMYAAVSLQLHHKSSESNENRFFLVRFYYQCYPFFGYCCVSAELTYVIMYVLKHATIDNQGGLFTDLLILLLKFCVPGCTIKQIVNIFQLLTSCNAVATKDSIKRM